MHMHTSNSISGHDHCSHIRRATSRQPPSS